MRELTSEQAAILEYLTVLYHIRRVVYSPEGIIAQRMRVSENVAGRSAAHRDGNNS